MVENFDIVYLYGFSELTGNHLRRLFPILKSQIKKNNKLGIVLIQDGVIGITKKGKISKKMEELLGLDIAVFAIKSDLIARGITQEYIHDKIRSIDYDDLIDIIDNTPKIISWL
ncbi:MAG: sulfurtransferase complex subunit TusB [Candidatus Lokiarchaeota archaeon]|nr:sulfurtransferase complex subunit TusB [Candidatus Lokiarchaeota archaeon]